MHTIAAANDDTEGPWLVYLLASGRDQPYAVGVGHDLEEVGYDAFEHRSRRMYSANRYSRDPFLLVWYEVQPDRERSLVRAAQIRRWPHAWQRRLVETDNPQWLEQWKRELGVSPLLWGQVPEISPRSCLPRTPDSTPRGWPLRSVPSARPAPRACADASAIPCCREASAQSPPRNGRLAAHAVARNLLVSACLGTALVALCASCHWPAA